MKEWRSMMVCTKLFFLLRLSLLFIGILTVMMLFGTSEVGGGLEAVFEFHHAHNKSEGMLNCR